MPFKPKYTKPWGALGEEWKCCGIGLKAGMRGIDNAQSVNNALQTTIY
jgi:hypothetical protein